MKFSKKKKKFQNCEKLKNVHDLFNIFHLLQFHLFIFKLHETYVQKRSAKKLPLIIIIR